MRHFAHNIGDYAAATAHLTFLEDAAYHRLLRRYYQDERPLPVDIAECQRLVGARTKEEKAAVRTVLGEFFTVEDDGWHQVRADREIEVYHAKAEAARANGTKGGRPANRTKTNPVSSPVQSKKLTTPHSPLPTPQEEYLSVSSVAESAPGGATQPQANWEGWKPSEAAVTALRVTMPWLTGALYDERMIDFAEWCRAKAIVSYDPEATWSSFMRKTRQSTETGGSKASAQGVPAGEPWEQRMAGWRKSKFWVPPSWGPRPGEPGCRVPAALLDTSPRYSATEAA